MHYVRVTLVTGQQLTITVDIPPGTPVDQLQIPGLPAPVASIVDLGSTESTPTPTATAPPAPSRSRRRRPRRPRPHRHADVRSKGGTGKTEAKTEDQVDKTKTEGRQGHRRGRRQQGDGGEANTESLTGKVAEAARAPTTDARRHRRRRPGASRRARSDDPTYSLAEPGAAKIGVPNFFIDQLPDPAVPAADLPGGGHAVRHPLGAAGRDQRDRDRLRPQPERLLRGRAGLDAVHARDLEDLRRRRQPGRPDGPVQPGRRDLRRRALPEGRRRRQGHPRRGLRLQPRRLVRGLGAAARPGHRRPAGQPRRLAHGPHRGPLPGRRQGDLRATRSPSAASRPRAQPGRRASRAREPQRASRSTPTPARRSSRSATRR